MIRRRFLIILFGLMLAPGAAAADDIKDLVIQQLSQAGFTDIRVVKTWLGRLRFEAANDEYTREIVVNPRTGEVLRDIWREIGATQPGQGLFERDRDRSPVKAQVSGDQTSSGSGGGNRSGSTANDKNNNTSSGSSNNPGNSTVSSSSNNDDHEDEADEEDDEDEKDEDDHSDEEDDG